MKVWPTTGSVALNPLPATSEIDPVATRLSPIVELLPPCVPVVSTSTVQVIDGGPLVGVTDATDGAVPLVPLVASAKSAASTPFTGSLKVTVQDSGPVSVGFRLPALLLIDVSVGAITS